MNTIIPPGRSRLGSNEGISLRELTIFLIISVLAIPDLVDTLNISNPDQMKLKNISLVAIGLFYTAAGLNHFVNPEFYLQLIPPYLPFHDFLNASSGVIELFLGIGILFPTTRTWAVYGIIALLVALIPAHVYMIQMDGVMNGGLTMPVWFAWFRLFPLQFLLMWWAWWHRD